MGKFRVSQIIQQILTDGLGGRIRKDNISAQIRNIAGCLSVEGGRTKGRVQGVRAVGYGEAAS